ncbi:MAG: PCMD domain-containing protein [Prevotellaceae bacterium]|nr:PCMD domain-containing protein [Prevotellaceae bacterium]
MRQTTHIFGKRFLQKNTVIFVLLFLFGACTKVMDLSDEAKLTDFVIKSVTPSDIRLGTPVIDRDTVKIPVLRGLTLFPMSICAEPVFSSETESVVPGVSFSSFDDIKFDLEDIQLNTFYLVARSGLTKACYIKLEIEHQENRNDIKQFVVVEFPATTTLAAKGFVDPIKQTITLYGINLAFPLNITACATLSDSAYIKDAHNVVDEKSLQLSFSKYGDSVVYNVEAENGDVRKWRVILEQAKEVTGVEAADILSAVDLDAKKQSVDVKSGGYTVSEIGVDTKGGKLILAVSPVIKDTNFEILPALVIRSNSQIVGYKAGEIISFANNSSTKDFIILDSRTGYYRKWQFVLKQGDLDDIYRFPFTYSSGAESSITLDSASTVIDNISKQIKLQVVRTDAAASSWPLIINAGDIECSKGATVSIKPLVFDNIGDSARFDIVSSLGIQSTWTVSLIAPQTAGQANIDSVRIAGSSYPGFTGNDISIDETAAEVFFSLNNKNMLPVRIQPYLYISEGAEFDSFQNGDFMEFLTFSDVVRVDIVSRSGETKSWKFQLMEKSQLPNSDFELWVSSGTLTIDPVPGRGRGWATANNMMVKGTMPVDNGMYGLAAELTTDIIALPNNLLTSATLFLGYFDMSTITLDKPRNMTKFGVPFEARPTAFAIDVKYTPGDKYQQSRLVSGSGILAQYVLDDLEGEDRGQIYAELIHWNGEGQLNYAGEPVAGVHVLARGERVISGKTGWIRRMTVALEKTSEYKLYQPTHLVFVAASSIDGHLFRGAKGSKLTVDNFELIY